jgi:hypothetical protein
VKKIKTAIDSFESNFGGTDILTPMMKAVELDTGHRQKRIFLLTDGQVNNNTEILNYASVCRDTARFHTFGIGSDCSKQLIREVAVAGRGSSNFAQDDSPELAGLVIDALKHSFEPSLFNCTFDWPSRRLQLNEIFRDHHV